MKDFCSTTVVDLKAWFLSQGEKDYHAKQVLEWGFIKKRWWTGIR